MVTIVEKTAIEAATPLTDPTSQGALVFALRALAHPVRLTIVRELLRHEEPVTFADLRRATGIPDVSHHLEVLANAGFITRAPAGWSPKADALSRVAGLLTN